ncbi:MAG: hypothetical protein AAFR14_00575 [Bacteroidota bacterium]
MIHLLAFLISSMMTMTDYAGTYEYAVSTPDGTVKGEMTLTKDGDAYTGTLTAYGTPAVMTNMVWEDNKLTFNATAAGYTTKIVGTFEGDTYTAIIYVEGFEIPMVAKKKA